MRAPWPALVLTFDPLAKPATVSDADEPLSPDGLKELASSALDDCGVMAIEEPAERRFLRARIARLTSEVR